MSYHIEDSDDDDEWRSIGTRLLQRYNYHCNSYSSVREYLKQSLSPTSKTPNRPLIHQANQNQVTSTQTLLPLFSKLPNQQHPLINISTHRKHSNQQHIITLFDHLAKQSRKYPTSTSEQPGRDPSSTNTSPFSSPNVGQPQASAELSCQGFQAQSGSAAARC